LSTVDGGALKMKIIFRYRDSLIHYSLIPLFVNILQLYSITSFCQ